MKNIIVFFVTLVLLTVIAACGKEQTPYELAKENHKLFRCKVNGEEWAIMELDYNENVDVYAVRERAGGLIVHAKNNPSDDMDEYIYMSINNILKEGHNKIWGGHTVAFIDFAKKPIKEYFIDNDYDNFIDIKYIDSTVVKMTTTGARVNIVADFEFRAITKDKIDTVLVNDGEFDMNVYWLR